MNPTFKINSKLWKFTGKGAWYFLTIEKELGEEIKRFNLFKRGWGSIPVEIKINETKWKTSIFPDKDGTFLLPVKKEIRLLETIKEGDEIKFSLTVLL